MKSFLLPVIVCFLYCTTCFCQSRYNDSLMAVRVTDSLPGQFKLYYTPGYARRAKDFQQLFFGATQFYEQRYKTRFNYRMAVLDSLQWPIEKFPFGFLAYDTGWVFLPAIVNAASFIHIYGIEDDTAELNQFLQQRHINTAQLSDAVYFVYSLHELGHYFIDDNKQVIIPDMFANELIATYFSYCYFKERKDSTLETLVGFSSFIKNHYSPTHRHIGAMDSLYMSMPVQNFKWFHCNIVLLCDKIYSIYGLSFIDFYLQTFQAGTRNHFTTQEVIDVLDKKCKGIVNAWATELANRNKQ